jgi:hypothetical protein
MDPGQIPAAQALQGHEARLEPDHRPDAGAAAPLALGNRGLVLASRRREQEEPGDARVSRRDLWEPGVQFPPATRPRSWTLGDCIALTCGLAGRDVRCCALIPARGRSSLSVSICLCSGA